MHDVIPLLPGREGTGYHERLIRIILQHETCTKGNIISTIYPTRVQYLRFGFPLKG